MKNLLFVTALLGSFNIFAADDLTKPGVLFKEIRKQADRATIRFQYNLVDRAPYNQFYLEFKTLENGEVKNQSGVFDWENKVRNPKSYTMDHYSNTFKQMALIENGQTTIFKNFNSIIPGTIRLSLVDLPPLTPTDSNLFDLLYMKQNPFFYYTGYDDSKNKVVEGYMADGPCGNYDSECRHKAYFIDLDGKFQEFDFKNYSVKNFTARYIPLNQLKPKLKDGSFGAIADGFGVKYVIKNWNAPTYSSAMEFIKNARATDELGPNPGDEKVWLYPLPQGYENLDWHYHGIKLRFLLDPSIVDESPSIVTNPDTWDGYGKHEIKGNEDSIFGILAHANYLMPFMAGIVEVTNKIPFSKVRKIMFNLSKLEQFRADLKALGVTLPEGETWETFVLPNFEAEYN